MFEDQTTFNQTQEVLQPPPTPPVKPVVTKPKQLSRRQLILIASVGAVVAVAMGYLLWNAFVANQKQTFVPQINIQTKKNNQVSEFGTRLQELKKQVEAGDPKTIDVVIPILDFELRL